MYGVSARTVGQGRANASVKIQNLVTNYQFVYICKAMCPVNNPLVYLLPRPEQILVHHRAILACLMQNRPASRSLYRSNLLAAHQDLVGPNCIARSIPSISSACNDRLNNVSRLVLHSWCIAQYSIQAFAALEITTQ